MLPTKLTLVLVFLSTVFATPVEIDDKSTLVLVHALFRHGNRTPDKMSIFPLDIYINKTYEPFGLSQLTTKGKKTEYNIGKYMRATYGELIPKQYTADVVYATATNYKRTKMSLQLVLAGLFPPLSTDKFEYGVDWQPIPFNIDDPRNFLGIPSSYCANYVNSYLSYILSEEGQKLLFPYRELYAEIQHYTGLPINAPRDIMNVYSTLKSEEDFGLKLPDWTRTYYPEILEEASSVEFEIATGNAPLKKLAAGSLLNKILSDSESLQNGNLPKDRKVFLYSAHEWNVATMLRTLNVFKRHVPPYGATLFFEIHNISGEYGLKLFYMDYTEPEPKLLTIPGCETFCKLSDLKTLVQANLPGPEDLCVLAGEVF